MLFMVIERFRDNDAVPIYQRLRDHGRGLPKGLDYVDSWVEPNFARSSSSCGATIFGSFRSGALSGAAWAPRWRSYL